MLKRWKQLSTRVVSRNAWWTYKLDTFLIPGGISGEYHHVFTNGSSMVVPLSGDGRIVMVKQYRYLAGKESIEFPSGGVKDGSTHLETARLELQEETGFRAESLLAAGEFNPYNGVTSEICNVYIATGLEPVEQAADDTEEFEVHYFTPNELETLIRERAIWDGMTLASWMLTRERVINQNDR